MRDTYLTSNWMGREELLYNILFILETNGIEIGRDESYAEDLSKFGNLHVRVSFKTGSPENFELITGRPKEWFELQIKAVENLYGRFHSILRLWQITWMNTC